MWGGALSRVVLSFLVPVEVVAWTQAAVATGDSAAADATAAASPPTVQLETYGRWKALTGGVSFLEAMLCALGSRSGVLTLQCYVVEPPPSTAPAGRRRSSSTTTASAAPVGSTSLTSSTSVGAGAAPAAAAALTRRLPCDPVLERESGIDLTAAPVTAKGGKANAKGGGHTAAPVTSSGIAGGGRSRAGSTATSGDSTSSPYPAPAVVDPPPLTDTIVERAIPALTSPSSFVADCAAVMAARRGDVADRAVVGPEGDAGDRSADAPTPHALQLAAVSPAPPLPLPLLPLPRRTRLRGLALQTAAAQRQAVPPRRRPTPLWARPGSKTAPRWCSGVDGTAWQRTALVTACCCGGAMAWVGQWAGTGR